MNSKTFLRFALCLVLLCPFALNANDTLVTLGAGGLVPLKTSDIVMQAEDLTVSPHQITVKYRFRNDSDRDVNATVAFPLPAIDGGDFYHEPMALPAKDPTNFVDFQVRAAGQTITPKVEVRAFVDGRDVTEQVRAAGLPLSVADRGWDTAVKKLVPAARKKLEDEHLIECEEIGDGKGRSHCEYWAGWETRVQFYWTQKFPANSSLDVEHSYRPVVGGNYIVASASDDGRTHVQPYCGGEEAIRKVKEFKKRHPAKRDDQVVLRERRIDYILTTANNWHGPIGDFKLTVATDSDEDIVATCMPGLKQVSPTSYELTRSNFRPDSELKLLILQPEKPE